jgi:hypothetical protein
MHHEVIVGKQALDDLQGDWDGLWAECSFKNFYSTYDATYAQLHYSRFAPDNFILVRIWDQDKTVAFCPLCIARQGRLFSLKSLEMLRTPQSPLRSMVVHRDYVEPVARHLAELMVGDFPMPYDVITLDAFSPVDQFASALIKELQSRLGLNRQNDLWTNVMINLDSAKGAEGYYRSRRRNMRESIARYINRLGKQFWWNVVVCREPGPALEEGLKNYFLVHENAWQTPRDPEYHSKLIRRMAAKDAVRLFTLVIRPEIKVPKAELPIQRYCSEVLDDQIFPPDYVPIATILTYRLGNRVQFVRTAYDHNYRKYSPGRVLLWFIVKYYMDRWGVDTIDMEVDDEAYKYDWGEFNENRQIFQIVGRKSLRGWMEVLCEKYMVPCLRDARNCILRKKR